MAKLYYCNDGTIDLKAATLDALRALPHSWVVLLNLRPAGYQKDRELDAVVITERGLHVIECKSRQNPLHIKTESQWLKDGGRFEDRNSQGESPKEQVTNSSDAFKRWLHSNFASLKAAGFSTYVLLEEHHPAHLMDGKKFKLQKLGHVWVVNGAQHLADALFRNENQSTGFTLDRQRHVQSLLGVTGAKHLDSLTVQGVVQSLENKTPLSNVQVHLEPQAQSKHPFEARATTDSEGRFEFTGVPIGAFKLVLEVDRNWQVLPTGLHQPGTRYVYAPVFVASQSLSPEQVQSLISEQIGEVRGAVIELSSHYLKVSDQQEKLEQDALHLLDKIINLTGRVEAGEKQQQELSKVQEELKAVQKQLSLLSQVESVHTFSSLLKDTQRSLEQEMSLLKARTEEAYQKAQTAEDQARKARKEARQATQTAEESKTINREHLQFEQSKHLDEQTRQKLYAEAMNITVVCGALGSIISMQPIPFADNVLLTPLQIGLVVWIGRIHGQSITQDLAMKILGVVGFGLFGQHLTLLLYKMIPGVTFLLGPITVFGLTWLLGHTASVYFQHERKLDTTEQKQLAWSLVKALASKEVLDQIKALATSAGSALKERGYGLKNIKDIRQEDLQFVYQRVSEQARVLQQKIAERMKTSETPVG